MKSKVSSFVRAEWLQLLLIAIPVVAALAVMPYATDRVPMQWDLQGRVTWYAPKAWGLLVMPASMLLTYALIFWMESRDPARHRESDGSLTAHGKATRLIRLGIVVVLAGVTLLQISWSLGHRPDVSRWVVTSVALLFAFMGNLFGKLKPNRYVGIRVPWTLNSPHVWRQTHRATGWIWTTSGLIIAVMSWLLPVNMLHNKLTYIWLFFLIVIPLYVAWYEARKERLARAA